MLTINHPSATYKISDDVLQVYDRGGENLKFSLNRKTGDLKIFDCESWIPLYDKGSGSFQIGADNRNRLFDNWCIDVQFSQKNLRLYVSYLGRFRAAVRPIIHFKLGEKALRRANRAINMKKTSYALRGSKNDGMFIPSMTIGGEFNTKGK